MPIGDLAPEITVLLTAVATLLAAMVLPQRRHGLCAALAIAGLAVAAALAIGQFDARRFAFSGTFALDRATGWARLMILAVTALSAALAPRWLASDRRHGEFYAMLLFSALGALAMAGAGDLMELVLGVLLSSVTGYVLAAYHRDWPVSVEAGMKYFLIGALANALMVIGVVLVMGMAGSTDYRALAGAVPAEPLSIAGVALVLVGLVFKLGAMPAHTWVPDVAEGAPAPAAAFLTVAPKIAGAIALVRLVGLVPEETMPLRTLIAMIAAVTMTLGNLVALWQDDVRRLIGWSSVSQTGYALMAVAALGAAPDAAAALVAFLGVYAVANMAAFAVIVQLRGRTARADFAGLFRTRPVPATALTIAFLSLVGIPPLAGFFGKFALFVAALEAGLAWLAVVAVANTVLSLFYYLRVIGPMAFSEAGPVPHTLGPGPAAVVIATTAGLLTAGLAWGALWPLLPATLLP